MKEQSAAFAVGAVGYPCIELLARGRTHWSMALLGGACVLALMWIARRFPAMPLVRQAALGAALITAAEFAVGVTVNLGLGWQVWDYSREFANLLGQICPLFSFFWFLLCLPVLAVFKKPFWRRRVWTEKMQRWARGTSACRKMAAPRRHSRTCAVNADTATAKKNF